MFALHYSGINIWIECVRERDDVCCTLAAAGFSSSLSLDEDSALAYIIVRLRQ